VAGVFIAGFTIVGVARSEEYRFLRDKTGEIDWEAECRRRPSVTIGMTEGEAYYSKWGMSQHINTTETAAGKREQWVRYTGPLCEEDGTVAHGGHNSYLYFENGRLVAIQR
jgi:hypothetical protein